MRPNHKRTGKKRVFPFSWAIFLISFVVLIFFGLRQLGYSNNLESEQAEDSTIYSLAYANTISEEEKESHEEQEEPTDEKENDKSSNNLEPFFQGEPTGEKRIALTFDDGPSPSRTVAILDILEKYDAKATFFMLGANVESYPDIANQVSEGGHEIGNHTWTHRNLSVLSEEEVEEEHQRTEEVIVAATGHHSTVFRPPYGIRTDKVDATIGQRSILWTVDSEDWDNRNPNVIADRVVSAAHDGGVVLMHDIYGETVEALDEILQHLSDEGYTFVTVSELME